MSKVDPYEQEILSAFEDGRLKSVATKAQIEKLKAAARATAVKDRRVNIRLSSIDLSNIQVKALAWPRRHVGGPRVDDSTVPSTNPFLWAREPLRIQSSIYQPR